MNIIQANAATAESDEIDIERFHEEFESTIRNTRKEGINISLGDMNAKVGKGVVEHAVRDFGLGVRNDRGERLIEFCQEVDLNIMNIFVKLASRRLNTWKYP